MTDEKAALAREVQLAPEVGEDGKPTSPSWRWIGSQFRHQMATSDYKGRGGIKLSYITASQVADRLDLVVGPSNWTDAYRVVSTEPWVVECTLTVFDISKTDVGYSNNPDSEDEQEPAKAAYSDAFKRAACKWGIGRWLRTKG